MAVIFDTDKAFLHIPKTGGMWVRCLLKTNHIDYTIYAPQTFSDDSIEIALSGEQAKHHAAALPDFIEQKNTFCILRDPVSWYESFWLFRNYSKKWKWSNKKRLLDSKLSESAKSSFDVFIDEMRMLYPGGFLGQLYKKYTVLSGHFVRIESVPKMIEHLTGREIVVLPDAINTRENDIQHRTETVKKIVEWEKEAVKMVANCA